MLVNVENIDKYFNGSQLLKNINLTIENTDRIGLIGVNGCGKSTLIKILVGTETFDKKQNESSSVTISNGVTIGFLEQNSGLNNVSTIREEMLMPFSSLLDISKKMHELEALMENYDSDKSINLDEISHEYAQMSSFFETKEGYLIDVKIKTILNGMGFENTPTDRLISSLSGGEKTRLALSKILLENPNLLILDEPTNHLDFKTLMWLEDYLQSYKGAILIISHDRYFLNKLCKRICEIENGILTSYKGDYTSFLTQKEMAIERQQKDYEQQQAQIAQLQEFIDKNKVRASSAKMAKGRVHALEKIEIVDKPLSTKKPPKIKLEYDIVPPKAVLTVKNVEVSVGEGEKSKLLIPSLDMEVKRGEKLGIVGTNGIGKSTILKLIQGLIPHKNGTIEWCNNLKSSYFEQENTHLHFNYTVLEELHSRYPRMTEQAVRTILGSVLLTGENVYKKVGVLSGGEKAKLCFAILMLQRGNVLILDEPTNHLDLATKEVLEEALEAYDGTIIFVSHDRYLLNRIPTRIIEISETTIDSFQGKFDFYMEIKSQQALIEQKEQEQQKLKKQQEKAIEGNTKAYKNKEQRSQEVQRKNNIKSLENEIDCIQEKINLLEAEIALPEIFSDYQLMGEKCQLLELLKSDMSEKYDEWMSLVD